MFAEVWAPPDVVCHPYHFGDGEVKQTWFWLAGRAPLLQLTQIADGRHPRTAVGQGVGANAQRAAAKALAAAAGHGNARAAKWHAGTHARWLRSNF